MTHNATTDGDVASATGFGPLVRLNPHIGWGPAGAFNWFRVGQEIRDRWNADAVVLSVGAVCSLF